MSDAGSTVSQADILPEHEPIIEGVRCPQCAKKDSEIERCNCLFQSLNISYGKLEKERDELRSKLEKAKETLKSIRDALRGNERSPYVVAKEALKQIGE
jgi:hypothetical protein